MGVRSSISVWLWSLALVYQLLTMLKVPSDGDLHPYTKHASLKSPLEVSFLRKHTVIVCGNVYNDDPVYKFTTLEACDLFQSSIFNKELLHTFEIDRIASKRFNKRGGEATYQHLKLWRNFRDQRHFISFFANNSASPCHMEFPVTWFQMPAEWKDEKPARLEFHQPIQARRPRRSSSNAFRSSSTEKTTAAGRPTKYWLSMVEELRKRHQFRFPSIVGIPPQTSRPLGRPQSQTLATLTMTFMLTIRHRTARL